MKEQIKQTFLNCILKQKTAALRKKLDLSEIKQVGSYGTM